MGRQTTTYAMMETRTITYIIWEIQAITYVIRETRTITYIMWETQAITYVIPWFWRHRLLRHYLIMETRTIN